MYDFLTVLTGLLFAAMIPINGALTAQAGLLPATAMVHLVGTVFAAILCVLLRQGRVTGTAGGPWWMWLGGVVGVSTVMFQSYAAARIGMTAIMALLLLGQTVAALLTDSLGLLGMPRRPFRKTSLVTLAFALAGILVMLGAPAGMDALSGALAFASGVTTVLSRTVNARLSQRTGALGGSLINHLTGLAASSALALAAEGGEVFTGFAGPVRPWVYTGGLLGVAAVLLCNVTVPRVSAFRVTVLTFTGQIFAGVVMDLAVGNPLDASFLGGLIIAAGIAAGYVAERLHSKITGLPPAPPPDSGKCDS